MKAEWEKLQLIDCDDIFAADGLGFSNLNLLREHKKHDKKESDFFKEEIRCSKWLCGVVKLFSTTILPPTS